MTRSSSPKDPEDKNTFEERRTNVPAQHVLPEFTDRPEGFMPPDLSPEGLCLDPSELSTGVWALMANQIPKDNNGVIVGDNAALIIDAGITPEIGRHIQDVAEKLTDRPVRYLVNTTYHGDHTFGNAAFDKSVTIVSSRINREVMESLGLNSEKSIRAESVAGGIRDLEEVQAWRKPDLVFNRFCEIDLGRRIVQLWHFGPGNGPGDTVVYIPEAKVAWTGNLMPPPGFPTMALVGNPLNYARSIRAMRDTLDLDTYVPGHGLIGSADEVIEGLLTYLEHLAAAVAQRKTSGQSLAAMYEEIPMQGIQQLPQVPDNYRDLARSLHRLNILLTYRWLEGVGK